ncbi:hypothetical protein GCM10010910_03510 [Microbacterium nanhaiense]|uniref:DUF2946 domain-containing protein n=1 Tax=Microbacterium nanhaiense TaxID=1301026 RepID=A0ABQ2MXF9_9MICO|nr:hypothetical protein GCM10010910_03510 [Microbacterium nanhaiense]
MIPPRTSVAPAEGGSVVARRSLILALIGFLLFGALALCMHEAAEQHGFVAQGNEIAAAYGAEAVDATSGDVVTAGADESGEAADALCLLGVCCAVSLAFAGLLFLAGPRLVVKLGPLLGMLALRARRVVPIPAPTPLLLGISRI